MSRRATADQTHAPGQDSFLDVIANLVGILIVLITVVGMQTKKEFVAAIDAEQQKKPHAPSALDGQVAAALAAEGAVEKDFQRLAGTMAREQFEINYRRLERDRIQTLITAAETVLTEKTGELTEAQKAEYELSSQLNSARRTLRDLKLAKDAASNAPEVPGVIQHLPTPMAKTVFGKELHLRLMAGKIAYVPLNEFVERLKEDAPRNSWKLKDSPKMTETLGPLDGFRMQYTLVRTERNVTTGVGVARASYVELERFVLLPESDDLGEPMDLALAPDSAIRRMLKDYPRDHTTITVWVYPDSFRDFRRFKAAMFNLGYATAGRPLPEGHPIGGSPDGSHSAAQ